MAKRAQYQRALSAPIKPWSTKAQSMLAVLCLCLAFAMLGSLVKVGEPEILDPRHWTPDGESQW